MDNKIISISKAQMLLKKSQRLLNWIKHFQTILKRIYIYIGNLTSNNLLLIKIKHYQTLLKLEKYILRVILWHRSNNNTGIQTTNAIPTCSFIANKWKCQYLA